MRKQRPTLYLEDGAGTVHLKFRIGALQITNEILDHTLRTNRQTIVGLKQLANTVYSRIRIGLLWNGCRLNIYPDD